MDREDPKKKLKNSTASSSEDSSDEKTDPVADSAAARVEQDDNDDDVEDDADADAGVMQKRREKRLAMNRASARARRKRKKVLIDSLSNQVTDLTKQNQTLMNQNIALKAKLEQLEQSLEQSKSTIATLAVSRGGLEPMGHPLQSLGTGGNTGSSAQEAAVRSLLLGAIPPLNAPPTVLGLNNSLIGDAFSNARAVQLLGQQSQMNNIMDVVGFNGVTSRMQQHHQQQPATDALNSLGLSNILDLLRQQQDATRVSGTV